MIRQKRAGGDLSRTELICRFSILVGSTLLCLLIYYQSVVLESLTDRVASEPVQLTYESFTQLPDGRLRAPNGKIHEYVSPDFANYQRTAAEIEPAAPVVQPKPCNASGGNVIRVGPETYCKVSASTFFTRGVVVYNATRVSLYDHKCFAMKARYHMAPDCLKVCTHMHMHTRAHPQPNTSTYARMRTHPRARAGT